MDDNKPTVAQFKEYVEIRNSGITNMFDLRYIVNKSKTGLTKPICLYIMQNFSKLMKEVYNE